MAESDQPEPRHESEALRTARREERSRELLERMLVPDLGRRERRKLELRMRIVEAAVSLFEDRGYDETRVADICERADIAHKTFFNHFPAKQDVLREVAHFALDDFLADLEEFRKTPASTRERLRLFFGRIAENAEIAGPMQRDLLTQIVHVAHESGTEGEQARKLHVAFGALVEDGLRAGDVTRAHSPETLVDMLMGAFYALMFNWANLEDYPLRRQALAAADFLGGAFSEDATPDSPAVKETNG